MPTNTQDWINTILHNTISKNLANISTTSENRSEKSWDPVLIPYHNVIGGEISTYFKYSTILPKNTSKEALVLSYNNGDYFIYRESFRIWYCNVTLNSKSNSLNAHFFINTLPDYAKTSQRKFHDNIRKFHPKAQLLISKLQSSPESAKIGFIMYIAQNF